MALSWAYIVWLAATMDMPGMGAPSGSMPGMDEMLAPELGRWSVADFFFMLGMWAVMMVGMMTPSVTPMVLLYARVGRQAVRQGKPFAATGWFATGYLLAWAGFSVAATVAQWALERAALLTPMMASASDVLAGAVLIAAGLYQWTPLKNRCLSQCQAPLVFIQRHGGFRRDPLPALRLGSHHGLYCVGCCWALMALLFVGGVMNVLWIASLTLLVLLEKLLPAGARLAKFAGAVFLAAGVLMLVAQVEHLGIP